MKIAILAPFAHAAFVPQWQGRTTGGAEFQLRNLGGLLTDLGHDVDFIMEGEKTKPLEIEEGRVWQIMPSGGVPLLKLVHPKGSTLIRFLRNRETDLLIQRGASESTAMAVICAQRIGIPFLFLLASDSDLQPGREILPHPQDPVLYRLALSATPWIVAQTEGQASLLQQHYGKKARVIPSLLVPMQAQKQDKPDRDFLLWGGNLRELKRPEWLIRLAVRFPEMRFLVFGGAPGGHEAYARRIALQLESLGNVEYLGWVSNQKVPGLFARAKAFLNTSVVEGFPNSFLEAWRQGIPVISTVDPGSLLTRENLGYFVKDIDNMALRLRQAWTGELPDLTEKLQKAARYVDDIHGRQSVSEQWKLLLKKLKYEGKRGR